MKARFQIEPKCEGWTLTCYYAPDDVAFRAYYPEYDEALEEAERFIEEEKRFQEIMQEQGEQQDVGAVREPPLQGLPLQEAPVQSPMHGPVDPYLLQDLVSDLLQVTNRLLQFTDRINKRLKELERRPRATKKARPCRSAGTAQNKNHRRHLP